MIIEGETVYNTLALPGHWPAVRGAAPWP